MCAPPYPPHPAGKTEGEGEAPIFVNGNLFHVIFAPNAKLLFCDQLLNDNISHEIAVSVLVLTSIRGIGNLD